MTVILIWRSPETLAPAGYFGIMAMGRSRTEPLRPGLERTKMGWVQPLAILTEMASWIGLSPLFITPIRYRPRPTWGGAAIDSISMRAAVIFSMRRIPPASEMEDGDGARLLLIMTMMETWTSS